MLASDGERRVRRAHEGGGLKKPEKRLYGQEHEPLPQLSRKMHLAARVAATAIAFNVCACSSEGSSDYAQLIEFGKKSWFGDSQNITLQQAAAVPYASIGVRIGDGPQQMLVLAADSGGEKLWTSASHIVLALRDGRIVRTVGLGNDLGGLRLMASGNIEPPSASLNGAVHQALAADFGDIGVYSSAIACTASRTASETIQILGQEIRTVRVDEQCEDANLDWSFVNTYWLDPNNGQAWRSIQHVHPGTDTVEIDVLRPPAG